MLIVNGALLFSWDLFRFIMKLIEVEELKNPQGLIVI